jgi:asparagine synthase (glutamine-hydrolysing)
MSLEKRGPDFQNIYTDDWVGLGHRRLSIIDTTDSGNQPMWDPSGRYCIVFNGEIFNYRELRRELENTGTKFHSQCDTEVLLQLYIREKEKCLNRLNGFFAFCVYDKQEQTFFVARDRYGIKPLLYIFDEDKFLFASEMKAVLQYGIDKTIDYTSLHTYLQLNYIPAPHTIFTAVKKLMPGHYLRVRRGQCDAYCYYNIPYEREQAEGNPLSYDQAKTQLKTLLEAAVQRRLVADVPLGSFLSGGIDSSVVTALAAKHKPDLHTFSIGFRDEKFFDETAYAKLVAGHLKTEHTVFSLTNDDLFAHVHNILDYIDEPFADSSAINVYILSRETRKHATVALSGDGADELMGGYNKHAALYRMQHPGWKENAVSTLSPLWKALPQSRNSKLTNKIRQLARFSESLRLSPRERYWKLAGYASEDQAAALLSTAAREQFVQQEYLGRKDALLHCITERGNINDVLLTDTQLVLPNDMLTKVDLMSMAQGLEVRVPFLDVNVVNFLFSLPASFKIDSHMRKKILQDAFRDILPEALYNRPKKGFEVPLLKWLRKEMRSLITDDLLSEKLVREQGIFDYDAIDQLKRQLLSSNPGDVHARLWALIVFQWWWKKHIKS